MAIPPPPPGFTLDQPDAGVPQPPPGFTLDAPAESQPTTLKKADFLKEVTRRLNAGEDEASIRAFEESVRSPEGVRFRLGPQLGKVVERYKSGYKGPTSFPDTTESNYIGAAARGLADAVSFDTAPKIEAGVRALFGDRSYADNLQEQQALRAIDAQVNPLERKLGQGFGYIGSAALLPVAGVLEGGGNLAVRGAQALGAGERAANAARFAGQTGASGVVGTGIGAVSGAGTAKSGDELSGAYEGGKTGGLVGLALPVGFAAAENLGSGALNFLSSTREAVTSLKDLFPTKASLEAFKQRFSQLERDLGRKPTIAEALGVDAARLRAPLSAEPTMPGRVASELEQRRNGLLAGTRVRSSSLADAEAAQAEAATATRAKVGKGDLVTPAQNQLLEGVRQRTSILPETEAAQAQAALATRARVGEGDLVSPAKEQLRVNLRNQVSGLPAGSDTELEAARRALDKANYGAVENRVVPLSEEDRILFKQIVEDTPLDSMTLTGRQNGEGILQRLEENRLTGLDFQNIENALKAGSRSVITKSGKNYANLGTELDAIMEANLPDMLAARRASFEARSAEEGAATAQAAVRNAGREPLDALGDLRTRTPEQQAGVTVGGVQGVLNNTSTADRAFTFAENLVANPDYAEVVSQSLPPGVGKMVRDVATAARNHVLELESLGLKGVGPSSAKFDAVVSKVLDYPNFAGKLKRLAPEFADDFINYVKVQRDFLDRAKSLGLNKAGEDAGKAYAFADRVQSDPRYVEQVAQTLPPGVGKVLTDFASAMKTHIDDLQSLGLQGVGPSSAKFEAVISKILDDPNFAGKLGRLAPQFAYNFINYARVQRDFINKAKALGIDKVANDVGQSYQFARKLQSDPEYAQQVIATMPEGTGQELVSFALAQKQAIDSVAALSGISPAAVSTAMSSAKGLVDLGIATLDGAGGAMKAGIVMRFMNRTFGLGRGPANKLADMLFNPETAAKTLSLLEKRAGRSKVYDALKGAMIEAATTTNGTQMPEGSVSVKTQPQ